MAARVSPLRFKPSLIFEITDQCNLACSFCYEKVRRKARSVSPETFSEVLRTFRPLYLQITGGEALLHPRFEDLLAHATRRIPVVQITTNGTMLGGKLGFLGSLKRKPLIGISLDFADERHDLVRKHRGLFKTIDRLVPVMKDAGIPVAFSSTVFGPGQVPEAPEGNIGEVGSLIDFSAHHDVPINLQSCSPAQEEVRVELGKLLCASGYEKLVNTRGYRELLIKGHDGRCRFTVLNVSIGADGAVLPTRRGECYFCQDCLKCYYSCVWESALLLRPRLLPGQAADLLRTRLQMSPLLNRVRARWKTGSGPKALT